MSWETEWPERTKAQRSANGKKGALMRPVKPKAVVEPADPEFRMRGFRQNRKLYYVHIASGMVFKVDDLVSVNEREIHALRQMKRGLSMRATAREMGYAFFSSLRQQLRQMREKFGVNNTRQLIEKADQLGILRVRVNVSNMGAGAHESGKRQPVG